MSEAPAEDATAAGGAPPSGDPAPPSAGPAAIPALIEGNYLTLAERALDDPLSPRLGVRCPRCGERLETEKPPVVQASEAGTAKIVVPKVKVDTCPRCKVTLRSADAGRKLVARKGALIEFVRGLAYVPRGFFRIVVTPKLWKFAVVPFLLNVLAIGLGYFLAEYFLVDYLEGVSTRWEAAGGFWGFATIGIAALTWILRALLWVVIAWLIAAPPLCILYKLLFMPVMEIMTEATERIVLGFEDEAAFNFSRFYANLIVAMIDAVLLTLLQGLLLIVLLPLHFVPFVGSLIWMVVPPALFAGMDYTDINLVRRGYTTREKTQLWRNYQWRFFGYGVGFFFLITIPLVNVLVIPAAAAGGALLYLELERK